MCPCGCGEKIHVARQHCDELVEGPRRKVSRAVCSFLATITHVPAGASGGSRTDKSICNRGGRAYKSTTAELSGVPVRYAEPLTVSRHWKCKI